MSRDERSKPVLCISFDFWYYLYCTESYKKNHVCDVINLILYSNFVFTVCVKYWEDSWKTIINDLNKTILNHYNGLLFTFCTYTRTQHTNTKNTPTRVHPQKHMHTTQNLHTTQKTHYHLYTHTQTRVHTRTHSQTYTRVHTRRHKY
jgi:hypothetical protein